VRAIVALDPLDQDDPPGPGRRADPAEDLGQGGIERIVRQEPLGGEGDGVEDDLAPIRPGRIGKAGRRRRA